LKQYLKQFSEVFRPNLKPFFEKISEESLRYRRVESVLYPEHGVSSYFIHVVANILSNILFLLWISSKKPFIINP
jgi:hypothetical protein